MAQFIGGGGGGGGGGGTTGTTGVSGVSVDAEGVLRRTVANDPTGQLARQRIAESMNRLDRDLKRPSKLRKVSLRRLEAAIDHALAAGDQPDDVMQHLAGLTRIDYVFCYPATATEPGDVVLAGPAEPWAVAPNGRKLGIRSGAPVVELQDLVTALRLFPPRDSSAARAKSPLIYCSIDPTQEGLASFRQFMSQVRLTRPPNQFEIEQLTGAMRDSLGMQSITIGGVSPKTHFAQVLVEADYRMKLIGIGIERPPVRLTSYVDRANPAQVSRNALQRWYFVPDYERIAVSDDGLAMQMVGEGVRLIGEDEFVRLDGSRKGVGRSNGASGAFTAAFTKMYSQLAAKSPVFAQLRNCIDLAVAAAFIQDREFYRVADWRAEVLGDESRVPVETQNAPQQVETAVTSLWKGSTLMTPIGGGVQIRPTESLDSSKIAADDGKIAKAREQVRQDADAWWWD
ncbi:MAG: DUF1598 domain-containing protein [Planctomycetota bacterium]